MNTMLHAIDGGSELRTYATPCGQSIVGDGDYIAALRAAGLVKYVAGPAHLAPDCSTRSTCLACSSRRRRRGPTSLPSSKPPASAAAWPSSAFTAWAATTSRSLAEAHQELVSYLKAHQDVYWVATFRQALDYATTSH